MKTIFDRHNVFVWLPTGKSLCCQVLPFLMDFELVPVNMVKTSAVLLTSSLVALMAEQTKPSPLEIVINGPLWNN